MIFRLKIFYSQLLSFCLVLLGFNSCQKDDPVDEYGVPSAKYRVKGKIVSKGTPNTPIKDIRVVMINNVEENEYEYVRGDTTYTNSNGTFDITREDFPQNKFKIKIDDVDEDANGSFDNQTIIIDFENENYTGGNSWYKGEASIEMDDIELSPKQKD